jgi:hypothetical protein
MDAETPSMGSPGFCELDTHDSGAFLFISQIPLKAAPLLGYNGFSSPELSLKYQVKVAAPVFAVSGRWPGRPATPKLHSILRRSFVPPGRTISIVTPNS